MELLFVSLHIDPIEQVWIIAAWFDNGNLMHECMNEQGEVFTTENAISMKQVILAIDNGMVDY